MHPPVPGDRFPDLSVQRFVISDGQSRRSRYRQAFLIGLERTRRQLHALRRIKDDRQDRFLVDLLGQSQHRTGQHQDQNRQHEDASHGPRHPETASDRRQVGFLAGVNEPACRNHQQQGVKPQWTLERNMGVRDVDNHLVGHTDRPQQRLKHPRTTPPSVVGSVSHTRSHFFCPFVRARDNFLK